MLIIFLPPLAFLFSWLVTQKFKDTFTLTKNGIETERHGIIEWKNIKTCSWQSLRGTHNIHLRLKNNTWLSIGPPSAWKNYSKGYSDLKKFFAEIKNFRESLTEEQKFKLNEGMFISS